MEENQLITPEMVDAYKTRFPDISDEGAIGSLTMWANGQGELDAELCNGNPVMAPVVEAYYAAKGVEVPESVEVPLTPVDEGTTDVMAEEKLSDAESTQE